MVYLFDPTDNTNMYVQYRVLILNPLRVSNIVELLFYVHGKHLWSCRDGQLT